MKISVTTYSFQKLIDSGEITKADCIAKAKELGFEAIDITELFPTEEETASEQAVKLAEESRRAGIPVSSYTVKADFLTGSNGDLDQEVERVKKQVDIAEILGAPCMRHDASFGYPKETRGFRGYENALPRLAEGCRRVTEYAGMKGIRTMVENHGFFMQDSQRVEKLINTVADDNFGWLCDIGNFLCVDEDPVTAVGRAAPYVFHAHAKDFHVKSGMLPDPGAPFFKTRGGNYIRGAIVGHGNVPVQQCLGILKSAGYDGYVSVEFEGIEPVMEALPIALDNLKRYLAAVEQREGTAAK